jgi:type 1 glutamine amidotransferase
MRLRGRHIVLILSFVFVLFGAHAQEEVATMEDGHLVFHLKKNWNDEKRAEVAEQYGLDSLMLEMVLASPSEGAFEFEGDQWNIQKTGKNSIRLSKNMEDLSGEMDWRKDMILTPIAPGAELKKGAGYVDEEKTIFGVNRLKENVVIQYPNGKTKFTLQGYEDANEVLISGSFNDWSTSGFAMTRVRDGWEIDLRLAPGKYLYKFIVDGRWISHPGNALYERDGWGGKNSAMYRYNHKFELEGFSEAKRVFVAGNFNNWNEKQLRMSRTRDGWVLPVFLKEGTYSYKFIVDGEWITDPDNPVVRPDGGGNFNSVLALGDTTMFRLNGYTEANEVRLTGTFNNWNEAELKMTKTAGGWELPYVLSSGNYEYKFIVDGEWMIDPSNPYLINHGDYQNSFLAVDPNWDFATSAFPDAREVLVTGNFTGWSHHNNSMVKSQGKWRFPIHLRPGKYLYKYVVDGEWVIDPDNPAYEENEFGSGNSVLWIESDTNNL